MNCKNCEEHLADSQKFCSNCGSKIVYDRISIKSIWKNFAKDFFGWDNKYFFTVKNLLLRPELVLKEYLGGTRKKYVVPFAFLAIGTALAMLAFNMYTDEFIASSNWGNEKVFEGIDNFVEISDPNDAEESRALQETVLKYFNLVTFLIIPINALMALFVFGKPYNYGEHLVITCYIQGFVFLITTLFFVLSVYTNPTIYNFSFVLTVAYYMYVYKRLYQFSAGQTTKKFFKFIGLLLLLSLAFPLAYLLGCLVGMLFG